MKMQLHKETTVFRRERGSVTRVKCWATQDGVQAGNDDNCYLVEQDGKWAFVDTCRQLFRDLVMEECEKTGLDAIILTHGHFDHCQNAAALVERFGAKVALSGRDLFLLEDQTSQPFSANTDIGRALLSVASKEIEEEKVPPFKIDVVYGEGKSLANELGIDARVFATPGHTQGHVAIDLWDTDLFVGDILMNPGEPVPALLFFDESLIGESVGKILALKGERTIHFGHGNEVLLSELRQLTGGF